MKSGGLLTFILMIIPMLAIPLLAILGIPQFIPAVASSTQTRVPSLESFVERRVGDSAALPDHDIRVPSPYGVNLFERAPIAVESSVGEARLKELALTWRDPLALKSKSRIHQRDVVIDLPPPVEQSNVTPSVGYVGEDEMAIQLVNGFENTDDIEAVRYQRQQQQESQSVQRPGQRQRLTWRQAALYLEQMGIRKYQLTAGSIPGEFNFSCSVTSSNDRKISRAFQAESSDPLTAVQKVLAQVDDWKSRR
jgi:hypothetical protein